MKAMRHEMQMSVLDLKQLEQGRDEEKKNTDGTKHEQHQNA